MIQINTKTLLESLNRFNANAKRCLIKPITDFKVIAIIITLLEITLCLVTSCKGWTNEHSSTDETRTEIHVIDDSKTPVIETLYEPILISLFIDRSASINAGLTDVVVQSDVLPYLDLISEAGYGSRLTVSIIGENTKSKVLSYYNEDLTKLSPPIRKRGQSVDDRRAAIARYKKLQAKASRIKVDQAKARSSFVTKLTDLLSDSRIHYKSEVCELFALFKILQKESASNAHAYIVVVSDGISTGKAWCPLNKPEAELLIVNRASHNGNLNRFKHKRFSSMEALLNYFKTNL